MTTYSHSRLETFQNCPLRFRLQYIDRIKRDFNTIEAFLGNRVHEVLEKLYKDLLHGKTNSLPDLLLYYHSIWDEQWSDEVKIINKEFTTENYKQVGQDSIKKYYEHYRAFDQAQTIGLELPVHTTVGSKNEYKLQGYIDRLTRTPDGTYEIHDYKTSGSLPTQEKMDADRQLALYQIAVQEKFKDAKNIRLIWHYLVFNAEIESSRTAAQLSELKEKTGDLIRYIEGTEVFEPNETQLCFWCQYWDLCPAKKHLFETEQKEKPEFEGLEGKALADKYVELQSQIIEVKDKYNEQLEPLESKLEELKDTIFEYADRHGYQNIFGTDRKLILKRQEKVKFPTKKDDDRAELEELLHTEGKWEEVTDINLSALKKIVENQTWDETILEKLKPFEHFDEEKKISIKPIKK